MVTGKLAALGCSLLLSSTYMGNLPNLTELKDSGGPDAGYSRRIRYLNDRNAIAETLGRMFMGKSPQDNEIYSPYEKPIPFEARYYSNLADSVRSELQSKTPKELAKHLFITTQTETSTSGLFNLPGGFFGSFEIYLEIDQGYRLRVWEEPSHSLLLEKYLNSFN